MDKREEKGITLAILIITLMVMVILAGTTIYTINKSPNAEELNNMYADIENLDNKITLYYSRNGELPIKGEKIENIPEDMSINSNDNENYYEIDLGKLENVSLNFGKNSQGKDVYIINEKSHTIYYLAGIAFEGEMYYTSPKYYEKIEIQEGTYIPKGFEHIEGSIDTGYVIRNKETLDEFVWIPVEVPVVNSEEELEVAIANEQYPMAVKTDGQDQYGRDNYRGVLYVFSLNDAGDGVKVEVRSSEIQEPANLTATDSDTGYIYDSQEMFTYQKVGTYTDTMYQEEYNELIESVKKYGGFYIGRYESGNLENRAVSRENEEGIANQNWYQMYQTQKNIYGDSSQTKTHMIWGSQYDQVLIWMKDIENPNAESQKYYILDSTGMGVYSDNRSRYWDGRTGKFEVKNVYDLAGNVFERTMEAYLNNRVCRGGNLGYVASENPASNRINLGTTYSSGGVGSRLTLYI